MSLLYARIPAMSMCVLINRYVPQETNQQIMEETDDNESINLEEVMSNPDHEVQQAGMCGTYCSII